MTALNPVPVPVTIENPTPVPVAVVVDATPSPVQSQKHDPSMPATTTFQEDLTTAGQRKVNLIWEYTQAIIALVVIISTMICGVISMIYGFMIPTIIAVAFGTISGFYFSRTNHAAIGGVGPKPNPVYEGR